MSSLLLKQCQYLFSKVTLNSTTKIRLIPKVFGSTWRDVDSGSKPGIWPNSKYEFQHHKHQRRMMPPFTYGVVKQMRLRVVDNSAIGMEAMALGRPPKVIHVYSDRHKKGIFNRVCQFAPQGADAPQGANAPKCVDAHQGADIPRDAGAPQGDDAP
jgi:hypothetical protein